MPSEQFRPWIKPLRFIAYEESEHKLRVGIGSAYKLNLIKDHFESRLLSVVRGIFPANTTVSLELQATDGSEDMPGDFPAALPDPLLADPLRADDGLSPETRAELDPVSDTHPPPAPWPAAPATHTLSPSSQAMRDALVRAQAAPPSASSGAPLHNKDFDEDAHYDRASRLRRDLTLNDFVEGRGNQMALAAAMEIIERPGTVYNPLVVVGGVGLGKTHLLHAVGNAMHAQRPSRRIQYVHAQEYFEEMVRAIQRKNPQEFKQRYQNLDLLLIDDIQFLGGKERTQEEFFYTFEALFASRKQLMVTCDTYPKDLGEFQDRLKSRLGSGLIVEIALPDIETRTAILLKKAEGLKADLPDDVAQFIAKHLRSNVRELEGALLRVIAFARFRSRPVSIELAREALNDLLELNRPPISIEHIQKMVADHFKIKVADMYSKRRPAHIAYARQVAMYFAKELTQKSFPEIGEAFGGRDHTTVMHAVKKVAEVRQKDVEQNRSITQLEQTLRG